MQQSAVSPAERRSGDAGDWVKMGGMGNKDVRKEAKTRLVSAKSGDQAIRAAASTVSRGGLQAFENACKAIAAQDGLLNRQGDGKFWRDNTDPALLAARGESDRRWLTMPVAWSQAKPGERMWLLPRMIFCAGKSSMNEASQLEEGRGKAENLACSQLVGFAKRAFGDVDWAMSESSWVDWVGRGVANGSPTSSLALLEAMKDRMPKEVLQALAAKSCAVALSAGASLSLCKAMAGLAGGVRHAEHVLERMGRANRAEIHPHESDYALARRIGRFVDEPSRRGSLVHRALDALGSRMDRHGPELSMWIEASRIVKWLCAEGAKMDALGEGSPEQDMSLLCPMGRACAAGAWGVLDALLEAGADASGSEGCSMLPLSVLCWRINWNTFSIARFGPEAEAASRSAELRALTMLLEAGAAIDAPGAQRETALLRAAGARRFDLFERLVQSGADLSKKDEDGFGWKDWAHGNRVGNRLRIGQAGLLEFVAKAESLEISLSTADSKMMAVKPRRL